MPSSDHGLSKAVFQEVLSAHLCLPSPAVRDGGWVGSEVPGDRGGPIDHYGDVIMNSNVVPGDSWRKHHDQVKQHIVLEATLAPALCIFRRALLSD